MRKVQDYYFKKAKKDQYPARSVYKLEEVQAKYRFMHRGDSVLDLGCFPGSWSLFAAEVVGPKGVVVGVDLQQAIDQLSALSCVHGAIQPFNFVTFDSDGSAIVDIAGNPLAFEIATAA